MYGYYREKFHVSHFWELKGQDLQGNMSGSNKFMVERQGVFCSF